MSQVRSKNTLPERLIFEKLKNSGLKFKKHYKLPGKPDIVFIKEKLTVFIDGEFWHGKNFIKWKDSLSDFWLKKIGNNIERDRKNREILRKDGWKIIRLWGKNVIKNPEREVKKIIEYLS